MPAGIFLDLRRSDSRPPFHWEYPDAAGPDEVVQKLLRSVKHRIGRLPRKGAASEEISMGPRTSRSKLRNRCIRGPGELPTISTTMLRQQRSVHGAGRLFPPVVRRVV